MPVKRSHSPMSGSNGEWCRGVISGARTLNSVHLYVQRLECDAVLQVSGTSGSCAEPCANGLRVWEGPNTTPGMATDGSAEHVRREGRALGINRGSAILSPGFLAG